MKVLIIGASGFVGGYLIDELIARGEKVYVTKMATESFSDSRVEQVFDVDILDQGQIAILLQKVKPQVIYHLAAQSSVKLSWQKPQLTVQVNIVGAVNLFEAVRNFNPKITILVIGSSEEYGTIDYSQSVSETVTPQPNNVYAITKLAQEQLAKMYVKAYGMNIIMTRSFNHIGAKQSPQFVVADFCRQVATIERGIQEPVIRVGNLAVSRDFTDVRDVVKAYCLLATKGAPGEVYNVGSGKAVSIKSILQMILQLSTQKIRVEVDSRKFRPIEIPSIKADITKLVKLGWQPQIPLSTAIAEILAYHRSSEL